MFRANLGMQIQAGWQLFGLIKVGFQGGSQAVVDQRNNALITLALGGSYSHQQIALTNQLGKAVALHFFLQPGHTTKLLLMIAVYGNKTNRSVTL